MKVWIRNLRPIKAKKRRKVVEGNEVVTNNMQHCVRIVLSLLAWWRCAIVN